MKKKVKRIWGNFSIRRKLLVTMLGVVFCSISILCGSFYYVSSNIIRKNLRRNIQSTLRQIGENLDNRVESINNILFDLSLDSQLQNALTLVRDEKLADYEWAGLGVDIKNRLIYQCTRQQAITAVFLTDLDGNVYSTLQKHYARPQYTEEEIYESGGENLWMRRDKELDVIPIGKAIYSLKDQTALGCLIIYVEAEYFESVFSNVSFSEKDYLFAVDGENDVILGSAPENEEDFSFESTPGKVMEIVQDGKKQQMLGMPLKENEWIVCCVAQDESENEDMAALKRLMAGVLLGVSAAVLLAVLIISRSISSPIKNLVNSMEEFGDGNLDVNVDVRYRDEIGWLGESFNAMVDNTRRLIREVYVERSLKQQAQLLALQMQINPHFLYNILETINWLAIEKGSDEIANVSRNLGKLMRFSLKKEKMCSLEEELDAVENYIGIQKYRHGESLHMKIDAEESSLYEMIPIHILLPLVENAVEHGLSEKLGEKNIWICCRIKEDRLKLSVCDNGTGIEKEKREEILSGKEPENKEGHMSIGMGNVQKRLRFYYGDETEFGIRERKGGGTIILISIPLKDVKSVG